MDAIFATQAETVPPRSESPEPEPQAAAPETPQEAPQGRERDGTGRFVAKPSEEAEKPAAEPAKPQAPLSEKETVGFYKAMQEERDKRQALERQLADLKAKATPEEPIPADQRMMAEIQRLQDNQNRTEAHLAHGKDAVKSAYDWAFARCERTSDVYDPVFNTRVASMIQSIGNPYEVAVLLKKEADDLDALKTGKAAPATPPSPQPDPSPPPRSLADAPGNGAAGKAHVPTGEGEAYGSIFR